MSENIINESPYKVTKTLTYNDIITRYEFPDRLHTKKAWIFFKNRFPERYFDPNYFDQWAHRFNQGYADKCMDYKSLGIWVTIKDHVDELLEREKLDQTCLNCEIYSNEDIENPSLYCETCPNKKEKVI